MNVTTKRIFALAFVTLAIVFRFVEIPHNFAWIGAVSLFVGCYLRGPACWILPLGGLAISDWLGHLFGVPSLHMYYGWSMLLNYIAFAAYIGFGHLLRNRDTLPRVLGCAFVSSIVFFFVSNFGAWLDPQLGYESSLSGLANCYQMAVPFYRATLASDLICSLIVFGTVHLCQRMLQKRAFATVKVEQR